MQNDCSFKFVNIEVSAIDFSFYISYRNFGTASRKFRNNSMSIIPKYFQEILSIIMKCPFCGHQENHKHGKTSNVLNDIIVLNAYKLSPILLTLFTTGEKLDMKKSLWFYRLMLRLVV